MWHADKACEEELRKKVADVTLEAEVYKLIRTCPEQTSEISFDDCLSGLLKRLESHPKTRDFYAYFVKERVNRKSQWAFCLRLQTTLNMNMLSEAFHRVFKGVYLGGKVNK